MRLWTLALASAFVWVVTSGTAAADSEESAAAAPEVQAEEAAPAPEDGVAIEDPMALDDADAPDAMAAEEDAGQEALGEPVAPEEAAAPQDPMMDSDQASAAGDPAAAGEAVEFADGPAADVNWDDFEDPAFDPSQAPAEQPVAQPVARSSSIPLGPMGVDEKGVQGRIHTVSTGETLWDISDAYLGTPWVWPSVWHENSGIDNPHRIDPGDKIWITSNEMRRVTDAEAGELLDGLPADQDVALDVEMIPEDDYSYEDEMIAEEPPPAFVEDEDELSAAMPLETGSTMTGEIVTLPREAEANYTTAKMMDEASQIVDAPSIRAFLTQGDETYLDLGEGEVEVGDQFSIFRTVEKIRDLESGAVLGYHFDELGWLEVARLEGESSVAIIRGADSEIQRTDRLVPRQLPPTEVAVRAPLEDIEGSIVFTPGYRFMMGTTDSVYLNVGSIHGVELGTQMEVYLPGEVMNGAKMPDTVVARMVVISLEPETSVAFVTHTERELEIGDTVRGVMPDRLAAR
jgi:nucleoid-associated protein YgaU